MTTDSQQTDVPCPFCGKRQVRMYRVPGDLFAMTCDYCQMRGPCDHTRELAARRWGLLAQPNRAPEFEPPAALESAVDVQPSYYVEYGPCPDCASADLQLILSPPAAPRVRCADCHAPRSGTNINAEQRQQNPEPDMYRAEWLDDGGEFKHTAWTTELAALERDFGHLNPAYRQRRADKGPRDWRLLP